MPDNRPRGLPRGTRHPRLQAAIDAGLAGGAQCVEWPGSCDQANYGKVAVNRRMMKAARHVYELKHGTLAKGLEADHLCHNPPCVNVDHLEAVTHAVNMKRTRAALSTICQKGHEYTPETTQVNPKTGRRMCRTCANARYRTPHAREVGRLRRQRYVQRQKERKATERSADDE